MSLARQRYGGFSTGRPPSLQISYRVDGADAPLPRAIHAARQQPLGVRRCGAHVALDGGGFSGTWDRASGHIEILGPLATYPIDRLIEAMVYAVKDRVVILHAAAIVFGGRGFVCSGPSGSGKSTLANLFPDQALCDEHVAVQLGGPTVLMSSLPFWRGRRGTASVEAIYLLEHSSTNSRRLLAASEAVRRLRSQVIWPTGGGEFLRKAFDTFSDLLERVPIWELGFRPETAVREIMTGEERG